MELDKALEFAVILAWQDLMTGGQVLSARVEYESKRGLPVDFLTVWTLRSGGYQDRACDYSTRASPAHPVGVRFTNSYHSNALAHALDFIMKNQDQFTHPDDAWRPHLVMIQPPTPELAAEATAWMAGTRAAGSNRVGSKANARRTVPRRGPNPAAFSPRLPSSGPGEVVDDRSGFPNGPWCR